MNCNHCRCCHFSCSVSAKTLHCVIMTPTNHLHCCKMQDSAIAFTIKIVMQKSSPHNHNVHWLSSSMLLHRFQKAKSLCPSTWGLQAGWFAGLAFALDSCSVISTIQWSSNKVSYHQLPSNCKRLDVHIANMKHQPGKAPKKEGGEK